MPCLGATPKLWDDESLNYKKERPGVENGELEYSLSVKEQNFKERHEK